MIGVLGDGVLGRPLIHLGEDDGEKLEASLTVGVTDRGLVRAEL